MGLYKDDKYPHNRIVKVANVMSQRLRVLNANDERTKLSFKYFNHLKERTKLKDKEGRKKFVFKM